MKTMRITPQAVKHQTLADDYTSHGRRMFMLGVLAGMGIGVATVIVAFWIASQIVI